MSLRTKMSLGVTFIVVLLTGGFTFQSVRRQSETMRSELLKRGQALFASAARSGGVDLQLGDKARIRQRIPLLLEEPDVSYVLVLDMNDEPIVFGGLIGPSGSEGAAWEASRIFAAGIPAFPQSRDNRQVEPKKLVVQGHKVFQLSAALIDMTEVIDE